MDGCGKRIGHRSAVAFNYLYCGADGAFCPSCVKEVEDELRAKLAEKDAQIKALGEIKAAADEVGIALQSRLALAEAAMGPEWWHDAESDDYVCTVCIGVKPKHAPDCPRKKWEESK